MTSACGKSKRPTAAAHASLFPLIRFIHKAALSTSCDSALRAYLLYDMIRTKNLNISTWSEQMYMYRVAHLLANLGWVAFDLGYSRTFDKARMDFLLRAEACRA